MQKLSYLYTNEPDRYPDLSQREISKRVQKINDFIVRGEKLQEVIRNILENDVYTPLTGIEDLESQSLMKRGEDGEFDATRGLSNQ